VAPDAGALAGGKRAAGVLCQELGLRRLCLLKEVVVLDQPSLEERLVLIGQLTQQVLPQ
jgi:hypothetical protein